MIKKIVASIILILVLCGAPFTLSAQGAKCTISGKVIDQHQSPVAYASVAIYQGESPIAGVVTDSEGKFSLKTNHSTTEYRLAVEFIGYEKYEGLIVPNKAHIDLGTILLKEAAVEVAEVVVTGKEVAQKTRVCPSALHSVYQAIAFAQYYTPNSRDTWEVSGCRFRVRLLPYKLQNYSCLRQIYE